MIVIPPAGGGEEDPPALAASVGSRVLYGIACCMMCVILEIERERDENLELNTLIVNWVGFYIGSFDFFIDLNNFVFFFLK